MRPYRGQTKQGKWVYGWYVYKKRAAYNTKEECAHLIVTSVTEYTDYGSQGLNWHFVEVIKETVAQSTGKHDKNKEDVFAGDKVRGRSYIQTDGRYTHFEGVVEWSDHNAGYFIRGKEKDGNKLYLSFDYIIMAEFEVIGTVHDKEQP